MVVTDLDGTLWTDHEDLHPRTIEAWHELERRGIPVLVATGRRVTSTREPLARLGLAPPAVVMNGALALDLETGERFHRHHYTAEAAVHVLGAFRAVGLEPCVYVEHSSVDVFVGDHPSTHPEHLRSLGSTARPHDLHEVVTTVPVFMFGIMGHDREPLVELARVLGDTAEAHVVPDQYGAHALTVAPRGLSKWVGVLAYCMWTGLDPHRVLAIGDGPNDRELLTNAAIAVAPEDGHTDARAAAGHLVGSPRVGGWADILELI